MLIIVIGLAVGSFAHTPGREMIDQYQHRIVGFGAFDLQG